MSLKTDSLWDPIEKMPLDEIFAKDQILLNEQLKYSLSRSRFYQTKYQKAGIRSDEILSGEIPLSSLPFTEKSEILDDQRDNPPYGNNLCVPMEEVSRIHRTSGYSGNPYLILLTQKDIDLTMEAGARMFWCAGVRPDDVVVHCLNYNFWIGGITDHLSLERTGAAVIPFGVGNTRALIDLLLKLKPSGISCTPSYLSKIEKVLLEDFHLKPRDLFIQKGIFGGEPGIQSARFRNSIEEKWGMKAIDANFGVSDILSAFGSECEFRTGLHFHGQNIIFPELIDPSTETVIEIKKGAVGEMVYTSLLKEAQPLIRFRSHDLTEILDVSRCACGRTGFKFRILGRSDEMIVIKGINVFPSAFGEVISRYPDLLSGEYQIILMGKSPYDHIHLLVEHGKDVSAEKMQNILVDDIKTRLSIHAVVELVPFGRIERSEGKTKRIVFNDKPTE